MSAYDVIDYKMKIAGRLIELPNIITLLNNEEIIYADELINNNIFSYMKVPKTTMKAKNYICFDYNSKIFTRNEVLKSAIINIGIICHEDDIHTHYGNRHDVIAGVIIDDFNWSKFLGFELELVSDCESILEKDYHVRTLQFKNLTPNSLSNGVKMDGY